MKQKPSLTKKVLRGLQHFSSLVRTGGMSEILGNDLDHSAPSERKELRSDWSDIETAVKWINEMIEYKQSRKAP